MTQQGILRDENNSLGNMILNLLLYRFRNLIEFHLLFFEESVK
jgi:hypothetical protein